MNNRNTNPLVDSKPLYQNYWAGEMSCTRRFDCINFGKIKLTPFHSKSPKLLLRPNILFLFPPNDLDYYKI